MIDRFSNLFANGDFPHTLDLPRADGEGRLAANHPRAAAFVALYQQMHEFAAASWAALRRDDHLPGAAQLGIVPLENASMPGRVVAQWDKDDCEDLGIIKVDLLGLGMMSVLQDTVTLTRAARAAGRPRAASQRTIPRLSS